MADISQLSRLINGFQRNVDVSQNALVVGSLKVGSSTPVEITKAIATKLIAVQAAADADGTFDTRYNTKTQLASQSAGQGASLIGIQDAGGYFPGTTVEAALQQIGAAIGTGSAEDISFDPSTSSLDANDLQEMGEEIAGRLDATEGVANAAIPATQKGQALGVATLDGAGKVPLAQLPNSIMQYAGMYNASTNTPALADGAGNDDTAIGDVYRVSVAGSQDFGSGPIDLEVGDYVILNASKVFEKSDATDAVTSVNGLQGSVVIGTDQVNEGSTNLYHTDERAQDAVGNILSNSSTIDLSYNDAEITAEVKDNSIDENKLTDTVADQETLTGGNGLALQVMQSPLSKKNVIAGESMAADVTFAVRLAVSGETAGRFYKADIDASVDNKFFVVGLAKSVAGISAGSSTQLTFGGTHQLGANDTPFASGDIGKPVYLSASGALTLVAPSAVDQAVMRVGMVEDVDKIFVGNMQLHGIN